ncbi:MAG TPA: cupin domain-containing protein [Candidatus Limnocylindrales bacterium]|nr:cupin domain-containing protein [Candidatus Limnocylindrales bacterium]
MANLIDLATIPPLDIWGDSVRARAVEGERITFAVVELAPGAVVPEHRHEAEQVGIVIEGTVTFTIADETRDLGPGGTWRIPSQAPHTVVAGPAGAIVIDTFSPTRDDWDAFAAGPPRPPVWPR